MNLCFESHTFDWRPDYPLVVCAKRYWDPSSHPTREEDDGVTCVLAHGTGFHGEQWEPALHHLFSLAKKHCQNRGIRIREAWSVECPNHGDSAIMNESVLTQGGYDLVFSWGEYAYALYLFLTQNKKINFTNRRVIGIGHSMGAVTLSLTQTYPYPPKFEKLILCEPMIPPTDVPRTSPMLKVTEALIGATNNRRDVWPSVQDASSTMRSRRAFAMWDEQVFALYMKYGLRPLPTETYPDKQGVTLKCSKTQEVACYRDTTTSRRMYDFLPTLCARVPVHVIWGAIDDLLATEIKRKITDATCGRKMASVTRVDGAGHLIVQVAPKGLASAIFSAMAAQTQSPTSTTTSSTSASVSVFTTTPQCRL